MDTSRALGGDDEGKIGVVSVSSRIYAVNPVYRQKELDQFSFWPQNELNLTIWNSDCDCGTPKDLS
jgi:hypothetical protein